MFKRGRFLIAGSLCIAAASFTGCSLTTQMWRHPAITATLVETVSSSVDAQGNLLVTVLDSHHAQHNFQFSSEQLTQRHDPGSFSRNILDQQKVIPSPPYRLALQDGNLWFQSPEIEGVIALDGNQVDWSVPYPYLAVVATPATLVVDILTAPINFVWILATAGGHGDPWIPWFDPHS